MVSSKSPPGFTTAPTAPSAHPNMTIKNVTFQNSATLACTKARSSSLFSLLGGALRLSIQALSTAAPSIASAGPAFAGVPARELVPLGTGRPKVAAERDQAANSCCFSQRGPPLWHSMALAF